MMPFSRPAHPLVLVALLALATAPAAAAPPSEDPLPGILTRIERYLRKNEVDGVTMDWRYEVSPSEEIRQTVVCQVLAYAELHRIKPTKRLRREILEHADFMLGRLEEIRSHSPFDGMLGYALWSAWEATGEERFRVAALDVSEELRAIPTEFLVLNGGLMTAMNTAKEWQLTGNAEAKRKTHDIVAQLEPYQNDDGSFPHWCAGTRDIHYTGWMAMELLHIASLVDDPLIPGFLSRMNAFLEGRIGPDGAAVYEGPCPWSPTDCTIQYWSRGSGCTIDYDSRGWTVEPAYCALLFDHVGSPQSLPVARFLDGLEDGGTLADQYAYWPPPSDPQYPWTIADTSVVNMSVIFWALATNAADRVRRGEPADPAFDWNEEPGDEAIAIGDEPANRGAPGLTLAIDPNPAHGACRVRFALERPGRAVLELVDARGRRVRGLAAGSFGAGPHAVAWDGRDDQGRAVTRGVYFARLVTAAGRADRRVVLVP